MTYASKGVLGVNTMGQLLTILSFPFVLMRQPILPVDIKYSSVQCEGQIPTTTFLHTYIFQGELCLIITGPSMGAWFLST